MHIFLTEEKETQRKARAVGGLMNRSYLMQTIVLTMALFFEHTM